MRSAPLAFALPTLTIAGLALAPAHAVQARELTVTVEIPRLDVAEYHRPYVAIWLERPDQSTAANLAVWYDVAKRNKEGEQWLKDLRQWWRRGGRELQMPVDGVSGATRAPGRQTLTVGGDALARLPAGQYNLVVEAAREGGGREVVRVPVQWPAAGAVATGSAQGSSELGAVGVEVKP
ncbi:DUF2271 domain-containing protein [Roseomonas sp. NAR14]|uniref:DUF2271 domain-containing protein n=1 Tax=Roseomonas acroporae TaxID=2937791 RepID=A0A9X1Y5E4_9PROT|nr:DUF2271 domain-containing protein [Roseomonas acroporae]MCK8784549.1 DUF2271 domain-containing protein [Roseomonas acroporae]